MYKIYLHKATQLPKYQSSCDNSKDAIEYADSLYESIKTGKIFTEPYTRVEVVYNDEYVYLCGSY
jgi:hypothetical protein